MLEMKNTEEKDIQQRNLNYKKNFKLQETKRTKRRILKYPIKKTKQAGQW